MAIYNQLLTYATIRAIERDARALVGNLGSEDELIRIVDKDLLETLKRRASDDDALIDVTARNLIEYSDFGDLAKLIRRNFSGAKLPQHYKLLCESLDALQRVRKRVMHSRNLKPGDAGLVASHSALLLQNTSLPLHDLREMSDRIVSDPSYVLSIELPEPASVISNNLPEPDSADTGLIGREDDLKHLAKLLRSPRSVISLIGEGGVGKSALALEAAYALIDSDDCPFETVIWSSMKTQSFGPAGIKVIDNDIKSAASLYQDLQESM